MTTTWLAAWLYNILLASTGCDPFCNTVTTVRPTHLVDRAGVARASYLVATQLGWLFREQETSDVGIDAHLEVVTGASLTSKATGGATGHLLAVQIKSGESQFATAGEGGWWYPCDAAHVAYWENHSLPVTLMLFDPDTERVHWQHVNADTLVSTGKHYKVFVPASQQINADNAEALSLPARPQQDTDPLQAAADRLPGDARIRLLRDHQAGARHVLPLAVFLADADDPAHAVTELLTHAPRWLTGLQPGHEEGAWKVIAANACAHELGPMATDALERAAATAPDDSGRLLALAAYSAAAHSPDRARSLADAAQQAGSTVLVSAARALLATGGNFPEQVPHTVAAALAAGDPAAVADVNVLRFLAHCHFAADRHEDGEDLLEKALRIAPEDPYLQLDLARCLLRRSAAGTPRQASFDTDRAQRLALAARADFRRWRAPSTATAAFVLLEARLMASDVIAAIHTAIAEPEGDAQEPETTYEPLQLEAVRLAYRAGRPDLADVIAAGLTSESAKLHLAAHATEAAPTSSPERRIAAWEAAAAAATDDDQRGSAAFALPSLGVWPVSYLDQAREQGVIPEAIYQTRWAAAEAAQGETQSAIRRLRAWESTSVVAATALVELYEQQGQMTAAAEAAERAGHRFGDTRPRLLAVELWDRSGATDQARIRALTLLSRPFLPAGMRRQLRGMAIQWAHDRSDWSDMEEHALVGLAEEIGIEGVTALEGAAGLLPPAALPFAWAAIRAQLNGRDHEAARDTLARFAPQIRHTDDAQAVGAAEVGHRLPDRDWPAVGVVPHGVLSGCEVAVGAPVGAEGGEFGLPGFLAGFPHHPGLRRVQQLHAPRLQLTRSQRLALLMHPPPQRKRLRHAHLALNVVGDGVEAGDLVLGPPAQQGLVALEPHQALRPVDPGAQERRDGGRVAGSGEVEQGRFCGGLGVVVLLVLAVLAAGADDLAVGVAFHVDLAGVLAAGEGAGGELLDESFVV